MKVLVCKMEVSAQQTKQRNCFAGYGFSHEAKSFSRRVLRLLSRCRFGQGFATFLAVFVLTAIDVGACGAGLPRGPSFVDAAECSECLATPVLRACLLRFVRPSDIEVFRIGQCGGKIGQSVGGIAGFEAALSASEVGIVE